MSKTINELFNVIRKTLIKTMSNSNLSEFMSITGTARLYIGTKNRVERRVETLERKPKSRTI